MRLKTSHSWRKHVPSAPHRLLNKDYYGELAVKQKSRVKKIIIAILILFLLQAIFQISWLRLDKINYETNQSLTLEEIKPAIDEVLSQRRFVIFKNNNYFLFNKSALEKKLLEEYNLTGVELNKNFPDELIIKLQEKVSQFVWLAADGKIYLLDAGGQINRQIGEPGEQYLILEDQRVNPPTGGQILSAEELNRINLLYTAWLELMSSLKLTKIALNDDLSQVRAQTQIGYYLLFDPTDDYTVQINNLKKVLAGNIVGQDIDYIDLRFGERVYFK